MTGSKTPKKKLRTKKNIKVFIFLYPKYGIVDNDDKVVD